jgi:RNA polymerase sigma factor (sigma-70 family)
MDEASASTTLSHRMDASLVSEKSRQIAEERFNRIMREYGPSWSRLAFGYERSEGAREELVQEIALAVWQALPHFRGECSERTFIYRIAHNHGLTHAYRRQTAHDPLQDLPPSLEPVDPRPLPEEQVAMTRRRDRLREAVQRLPLAYRQTVMLMLEDLSHAEIGEILGISESNVAVRLNRARKALKEALGERP